MKTPRHNRRSRTAGEGLVIIIIIILIIAGITWWLFNTKKTADREARAFGRQMIETMAVKHDMSFFASHLSPQAKLQYPPSQQQYMAGKFTELGTPQQPIPIEEIVTFESKFFSPRGMFTAKLNYPGQQATMQIAVSHPVGRWQLDDLTMTWDRPK